jgi:hypothetical protein
MRDLRKFAAEKGCADAIAQVRYRHVGDAARDGRFPVERVNNRYHYRPCNLPVIAPVFGIISKEIPADEAA